MEKQTMRIAIMGLGTVGKGLVQLLRESREMLRLKTGLNLELAKVLVRDLSKPRPGFEDLPLTDNVNEILEDPSIRIVVELMGGIEPARTYLVEALKRSKTIVTANKDVMAD